MRCGRPSWIWPAEHGVTGFMYYYYWFAGKRLLNLPIEKLAAS